MSSCNMAIILGNVGHDPEIRQTQAGDPVATFRMATSERWKDRGSGEQRERTEWHSVVCFNPGICKIIEQYVKKGTKLQVIGQLQTRKWQAQDGSDRYSTEIVLKSYKGELVLLGSPNGGRVQDDGYNTHGNPSAGSASAYAKASGGSQLSDDMDDEIPF